MSWQSFRPPVLGWVVVVFVMGISTAPPANAIPLSFEVALRLAEDRAPVLAAHAARVEASRSAAIPAGQLPDPKLFFGIDNFPVGGPDRGKLDRDFMTMEKVGIMQDVPNSGKRRAQVEAAMAVADQAAAQRDVEQLNVRRNTALAWLNRYYAELRLRELDVLDRENLLFNEAVSAQVAAGRGVAADALMPKQEALALADRRDDFAREVTSARQILRRWIGSDADEELSGDPPALAVDPDTIRHHLDRHPELAAFDPMVRMAEAEVRDAQAGTRPDWSFEFAYQRRAPQFGDMISAQVTIDLPFFTSRRQDPQIAAKQLEVPRIQAERAALLQEHAAVLENELAEYDRLVRALTRLLQAGLPLAAQKVELQMASYRSGKGDLAAVLAARRELAEARLRQIDLEMQRAQTAARLLFTYGEAWK